MDSLPHVHALAPLRVRGFPQLLTSYTLNDLGDAVGVVALSLLVYDQTGDPLATAALFIAAKFLPALLSPVLIARIDQIAVRRSLPLLYAVEAAVFVILAFVAEDFLLPLILVLALVDGVLALGGRALTRGAVATLLGPRKQLRDGNALMNIGYAVSSVGGAALGGLLVAKVGVQAALLFDAGTFALAGCVVATTRSLPASHEERQGLRVRLREGLAFVRTQRLVRGLLVAQAFALFFFTIIVPIEVVYAKETLDTGDLGYGLLLSAWGAGIVVGSLVFLAFKGRSPVVLVGGSTAAVGLSYLGLATTDDLAIACAISVVGGTGNGTQWVAVMTMLQEATAENMQARVVGYLESIGAAVPGLGFLVGGLLTSLTSPPTAYAVAGAGVMVLLLVAAVVMRGSLAAPAGETSTAP